MTQPLLFISIGMVVGMMLLALSLMVVQSPRMSQHWSLPGLLIAIAILVVPPLAAELAPQYQTAFISLGLLALMLVGPFLRVYIRTQTAEDQWQLRARDLWHFAPACLALIVIAGFLALPVPAREAMVLRGQQPEGTAPAILAIVTWLLLLLWVALSFFYLLRAGRDLLRYRRRIRDLFANLENRELTWLLVFVGALAGVWLWAMAALASSTVFNHDIVDRGGMTLMSMVAVWVLAVWGLRQRPGFEGHYGELASTEKAEADAADDTNSKDAATESPGVESPAAEKYSRSALDETSAARIAGKIEQAMLDQKLYLNADLTLMTLASHIGVGANYVSQTLNEYVGETFFDYVNRKRIEAAQTLLRDSDKSALDIAYEVGFNARSSFYKSFRRVVGATPKEFRQQLAAANHSGTLQGHASKSSHPSR
jgi:AraC-like DNA-binding protein